MTIRCSQTQHISFVLSTLLLFAIGSQASASPKELSGGAVTLSGADTYSGGTIVTSGTLIVTNSNALSSGSDLTVGNKPQTSLLVLDYDAAKTFGSVHIAGGAIDLTGGAMIVTTSAFGFIPSGGQYNEYGSPGVPEYGDAAIHDALVEGANYARGLGYWNGTNGIISSVAANNFNGNTAVGWLDNSIGAYTSWRGITVEPGQSIIGYTYYGDADMNGVIDAGDQQLTNASIGQTVGLYGLRGSQVNGQPGGMEWVDGDFYQDGVVDSNDDLGTIGLNSGLPALYSAGPFAPSFNPATERTVPEPATILLLASAAICVLGLRRKQGPAT